MANSISIIPLHKDLTDVSTPHKNVDIAERTLTIDRLADLPSGQGNAGSLIAYNKTIVADAVAQQLHPGTNEYYALITRAGAGDVYWGKVKHYVVEDPTIDISLGALSFWNKTEWGSLTSEVLQTTDNFTDKAGEFHFLTPSTGGINCVYLRRTDDANFYANNSCPNLSAQDHQIIKRVGGVLTVLAIEAVDVTAGNLSRYKLSVSGSTLKSFRDDMITPRLTVTDTSFTSGKVGFSVVNMNDKKMQAYPSSCFLRAPASPPSRIVAVAQVEVEGKGTEEDRVRPIVPQGYTWGAYNYNGEKEMIILIQDDRKHTYNDVKKEWSSLSSYLTPVPKTISDCRKLYKEIKMLSEEELIFRLLGDKDESLEIKGVLKFYERELIQNNKMKDVKTDELYNTLEMWKNRAKSYNDNETAEEFDKLMKKT